LRRLWLNSRLRHIEKPIQCNDYTITTTTGVYLTGTQRRFVSPEMRYKKS
jgi:hypothetical protein